MDAVETPQDVSALPWTVPEKIAVYDLDGRPLRIVERDTFQRDDATYLVVTVDVEP